MPKEFLKVCRDSFQGNFILFLSSHKMHKSRFKSDRSQSTCHNNDDFKITIAIFNNWQLIRKYQVQWRQPLKYFLYFSQIYRGQGKHDWIQWLRNCLSIFQYSVQYSPNNYIFETCKFLSFLEIFFYCNCFWIYYIVSLFLILKL